jgi:hypothetical protein
MSVVVIGGHERMTEEYRSIASRLGHRVKVFNRLSARFDKAIGAPDAIVLFTSTVSHKMVHCAVKEARRQNIPLLRCHTSSGTALQETLGRLAGSAC